MIKRILLVAMLAVIASSASAQKSVVDSLDNRVDKIEKMIDALPTITGYTHLAYRYSEVTSEFQIRRARVTLTDPIYKDLLGYRFQVEFAKTPRILDMAIDIKPYKQLNFSVGQNMIAFSLDNVYKAPSEVDFIDFPLVIQRLAGFSDLSGVGYSARDLGVQMYGSLLNDKVWYKVSVGNGCEAGQSEDNKSKDANGTVLVKPFDGLVLTGSYYYGETAEAYSARERWGAGISYSAERFFVNAEYIEGLTGSLYSHGAYASTAYWVSDKFAPMLRYDYFCNDAANAPEINEINYTVGLMYAPLKNLSVQVDYILKNYNGVDTPRVNQYTIMLVGKF
ncbi:MAG: porin [Rikenellaceae bacterium]